MNAYVGFNGWATVPEMRSGDSYINVLREANQIAGTYSTDEALFSSPEAYKAHLNGQYIDWADELLQTGVTQIIACRFQEVRKNKSIFLFKLLR